MHAVSGSAPSVWRWAVGARPVRPAGRARGNLRPTCQTHAEGVVGAPTSTTEGFTCSARSSTTPDWSLLSGRTRLPALPASSTLSRGLAGPRGFRSPRPTRSGRCDCGSGPAGLPPLAQRLSGSASSPQKHSVTVEPPRRSPLLSDPSSERRQVLSGPLSGRRRARDLGRGPDLPPPVRPCRVRSWLVHGRSLTVPTPVVRQVDDGPTDRARRRPPRRVPEPWIPAPRSPATPRALVASSPEAPRAAEAQDDRRCTGPRTATRITEAAAQRHASPCATTHGLHRGRRSGGVDFASSPAYARQWTCIERYSRHVTCDSGARSVDEEELR